MKDLYLHNPTYLELDDTYRGLPVLKSVLIKTSNYDQAVHDLERIGFVAIEILSATPGELNYSIRAFKGKHGPCYFTGKEVKYTGTALAALDDDNHVLFSEELKSVCDKTYRIFSLPPYRGLIEKKDGLKKPAPKDSVIENEISEDFESGLVSLYDQLQNSKEQSEQRKALFYPGPFRMLILRDGTIVYRGKWCSIPKNQSRDLIMRDRCVDSTEEHKAHLSYFQEEYNTHGSACLLKKFNPQVPRQPIYEPDFSKLSGIGKELQNRLIHVIDNHKKYFILIGNDIEDQIGCCPSREVTEANFLVSHGVLSSLAEPLLGDTCPVTMYAFKDELSIDKKGYSSKINGEFRSSVRNYLSKSHLSVTMRILKWILLGFVIISLVFAARKCQKLERANPGESLYEQLNASLEDRYMVVLFHNRKRCYQCLQMEQYTIDVLEGLNSSDEFRAKQPAFKTVVIDDPANANLVDRFGIFASTLVLLEFDKKQVIDSKTLLKATGMYRDEQAFKDFLENEIHQFLIEDE